jgi:hypothetical protein
MGQKYKRKKVFHVHTSVFIIILYNKNCVFFLLLYFCLFGCKFEVWRKKTHLVLQVGFFFIIISFIFSYFLLFIWFILFCNFFLLIFFNCISLSLFHLFPFLFYSFFLTFFCLSLFHVLISSILILSIFIFFYFYAFTYLFI